MSTHVKVTAILVARSGKGGDLRTLLDGMVAPSRKEVADLADWIEDNIARLIRQRRPEGRRRA